MMTSRLITRAPCAKPRRKISEGAVRRCLARSAAESPRRSRGLMRERISKDEGEWCIGPNRATFAGTHLGDAVGSPRGGRESTNRGPDELGTVERYGCRAGKVRRNRAIFSGSASIHPLEEMRMRAPGHRRSGAATRGDVIVKQPRVPWQEAERQFSPDGEARRLACRSGREAFAQGVSPVLPEGTGGAPTFPVKVGIWTRGPDALASS